MWALRLAWQQGLWYDCECECLFVSRTGPSSPSSLMKISCIGNRRLLFELWWKPTNPEPASLIKKWWRAIRVPSRLTLQACTHVYEKHAVKTLHEYTLSDLPLSEHFVYSIEHCSSFFFLCVQPFLEWLRATQKEIQPTQSAAIPEEGHLNKRLGQIALFVSTEQVNDRRW